MKFHTYNYTNAGARPTNEDAVRIENGIWVLADGLGGHDCGEVASNETVQFICTVWKQQGKPTDEQTLIRLLEGANKNILRIQKENPAYSAMRTTLVFAVTNGRELRFANIGDSRLYYFRDGKIIKQSEDHSVSAAVARLGEIKYEDIRNHEDRNKLLKVIGNDELLNLKSLPEPIALQEGDAFMLCSDGFWEYLYEQEMEIDLSKSKTAKEWMGHMVKRLLLRTENKDNDNFSAICVIIGDY